MSKQIVDSLIFVEKQQGQYNALREAVKSTWRLRRPAFFRLKPKKKEKYIGRKSFSLRVVATTAAGNMLTSVTSFTERYESVQFGFFFSIGEMTNTR